MDIKDNIEEEYIVDFEEHVYNLAESIKEIEECRKKGRKEEAKAIKEANDIVSKMKGCWNKICEGYIPTDVDMASMELSGQGKKYILLLREYEIETDRFTKAWRIFEQETYRILKGSKKKKPPSSIDETVGDVHYIDPQDVTVVEENNALENYKDGVKKIIANYKEVLKNIKEEEGPDFGKKADEIFRDRQKLWKILKPSRRDLEKLQSRIDQTRELLGLEDDNYPVIVETHLIEKITLYIKKGLEKDKKY